jgi:Glycosyl transferases group 1
VLVVCSSATPGWRVSARELCGALERAGAAVALVEAVPARRVRTFMLTDLAEAWAARRACQRAIARAGEPGAVIYCAITAALLWPRRGAIWLDAVAAENRPGRHGLWQRPVERRRVVQAPLLLTMAAGALDGLGAAGRADEVRVPVAVEPSGPPAADRDLDVLAYAGDPVKRRFEYIIDAWSRARRGSETLHVAGLDGPPASLRGRSCDGVRFLGRLAPADYRAVVRRARVFVAAPRREDFGIAPLEALADGCMLVTTPAAGTYPALGLARELDPRLVADDLAPALRAALDSPLPGYAGRAAELLAPFRRDAVALTVSERVLPRLLPGLGA